MYLFTLSARSRHCEAASRTARRFAILEIGGTANLTLFVTKTYSVKRRFFHGFYPRKEILLKMWPGSAVGSLKTFCRRELEKLSSCEKVSLSALTVSGGLAILRVLLWGKFPALGGFMIHGCFLAVASLRSSVKVGWRFFYLQQSAVSVQHSAKVR